MKVFQQLICVLLGFFYGQAIVSTVIVDIFLYGHSTFFRAKNDLCFFGLFLREKYIF